MIHGTSHSLGFWTLRGCNVKSVGSDGFSSFSKKLWQEFMTLYNVLKVTILSKVFSLQETDMAGLLCCADCTSRLCVVAAMLPSSNAGSDNGR